MSAASYLEASLDALSPALAQDDLVELCVNPDGSVWAEMQGDAHMRAAGRVSGARTADDLAGQIASAAGATLGEKRPIVSCSIEHRGRALRAQVVRPPAARSGVAISLRVFSSLPMHEIGLDWLHGEPRSAEAERRTLRRRLREFVDAGDAMAAACFCVRHRLNLVVSGGTSTGKTVALRRILSLVPDEERLVTIEEAAELHPTQPNVVPLLSDRDEPIRTADVLLAATLRMRPDRIVLGEVRGREAMTFLEAINTGHGGSMTTLHAETPRLAVRRLAIAALKERVPMTYDDMIRYIEGTIDVIVQAGRDGARRGLTEFWMPGEEAADA